MEAITLTKKQTQEIGRAIFADIFNYTRNNYERYFPWYQNELCKERGISPMKPTVGLVTIHPCAESERPDDCYGFCPYCDKAGDCPARGWVTAIRLDANGHCMCNHKQRRS